MSEEPTAVVILCCGSHCPEQAISAGLETSGVRVIPVSEAEACYRHDAEFVARRILEVVDTLPKGIPIGYAGAGVAGAGAIIAASQRPDVVSTVVAMNARTDFAADHLRTLRAPTLLIVNDMPVLRMNREAIALLRGERRLEIIHGEGAEALEHIVDRSVRWLADRLVGVAAT
ncbi:MAG: hypothetical protein ACXW2P_05960 [Thermoanaerobaculia bacterium]